MVRGAKELSRAPRQLAEKLRCETEGAAAVWSALARSRDKTLRTSLAAYLAAAIVIVTGLAGCGSSSEVVVQAGDTMITKATLAHWTPIEAILEYNAKPNQPVPSGVIPDPPNYTACIAHLEATPSLGEGQPKPQLKHRCRQLLEIAHEHILEILITTSWLEQEAAKQGLTPTATQIKRRLAEYTQQEFPTEHAFHRYLAITGMSITDVLLLLKKNLLASEFEGKARAAASNPSPPNRAYAQHFNELATRWTTQTNCHPGYIVTGCKQYPQK